MDVINTEFNNILSASADLTKHNDDFMQEHRESTSHVQSCLKIRQLLDPSRKEKNQQDLIRTLALEGCDLEDALNGLELMRGWGPNSGYSKDYICAAHARWPEASAFEQTPT